MDVKTENVKNDELSQEEFTKDLKNLQTLIKDYGEKNKSAIETNKKNFQERLDEDQKKHEADIEKLKGELKEQADTNKDELQKSIDEIHKKVERARLIGGSEKGERTPEEKEQMDAFRDYLKYGRQGLTGHEQKAYVVSNDAAAGALVAPAYFEREILDQALLEITPALAECTVVSVPSAYYEIPAITAHAVASRVAETGTTSADTTMATAKEKIRADWMTILIQFSKSLIMDSAFDTDGILRVESAQAMAKLLGTELCTGNGSSEMMGITVDPTITGSYAVNSGHATQVTASASAGTKGLVGLYYNLKSPYARNAKWYMRRATMAAIVDLKDGGGQFLLRLLPDQLANKPLWVILGNPVIESPDMPAIAANAYAIAFADLKTGYKILDVAGMSMLADPYSNKATNIMDYMWWKRIGGRPVVPEAINLQKIAA